MDRYEYKKRRARRRRRRALLWAIILLLMAALYGGSRLWSCLYNVSPEFNFLVLTKNELPLKLLNGEVLHLHPKDKLKILKISTNICLNRGVRLVAREFDVNALLFEEVPLATLLPERDIFNQYNFRVEIRHFNKELGHVNLVVEPHIEDWLERADRIIDKKRRIAILERALKLMPKDDRIRSRLVEEYKSLKRWPQAARLLEEMARDRPETDLLYDLLQVYGAMKKTDRVVSVLRRILDKDPNDTDSRLRLASILEKKGDLKGAIREYERLLKQVKGGERTALHKTLGYLYTKTGQPKGAIAHYLKALERDKKDVNLYYNLSYLYEKIGQKERADQYLERAVRLKSTDVQGRLKLAERLLRKGKLKEAEAHLSTVLKRRPKSLEALLLMIAVQEKKGDKEKLKETYYRILPLDPKNETIIHNLGVLEYETGNFDKALSHFKRLLKAHPKDPALHGFLFDIYRKQKKEALAFQEARTLMTLDPKEMSYYHYAFEYLNDRAQYERMIQIMKKGLKAHPGHLDLREYLVVAYLKTGREDLALEQLQQIIKKKPRDVNLLLDLAKLQEKQGKLPEALQTYEKLRKLSPEKAEIKESHVRLLLQLARLEEERGNFLNALKAYQKILEISPDHKEAEEAYLRLRIEVLPRGR